MTIKEAKAAKLLLSKLSDMVVMCLPEPEQKAVKFLTKQVEKKALKYPKYFKQ